MISNKDFIEIKITPEVYALAEQRAIDFGKMPDSLYDGERVIYGKIGEIICQDLLKTSSFIDSYEYDISFKGLKIDVKFRSINRRPNINSYCKVFKKKRMQNCDFYLFGFVEKEFSKAWIAGYMKKSIFLEQAIEVKKGDNLPGTKDYKAKMDSYEIQAIRLKNIPRDKL